MEAPPTILSYLEENDFSGNHRSEETSEAAKFKEQGTASGFGGFLGGWGNLHSLVLSLSFPCVWKATVIFWVQPGMKILWFWTSCVLEKNWHIKHLVFESTVC